MSRRGLSTRKRQTTVTIPERVGPHVKLVFAEMRRLNKTYDDVEEGSGVRRAAMKAWRHKNYPSLDNLEATLGFLGYDFVPIPREAILPPALVDRLRPLAAEFGLTMPQAASALISVVTRIHDRCSAPYRMLEPLISTLAKRHGLTIAQAVEVVAGVLGCDANRDTSRLSIPEAIAA